MSESIVILQISGGLLIFAAIATVRQQGKRSTTVTGIYWGVLAAITISCLNVIEKDLVTTIGILYYTLPVMVGAAAIMWIVLLIRSHQQKQSIPWGTLCTPTLFWLMALRAVSAYGFLAAFQTGALLSVASYISSLSVIILMILGAVWFNERDYPKQKIAAVILSVVGLTCILFAQLP